jgi:hypothetical protein
MRHWEGLEAMAQAQAEALLTVREGVPSWLLIHADERLRELPTKALPLDDRAHHPDAPWS